MISVQLTGSLWHTAPRALQTSAQRSLAWQQKQLKALATDTRRRLVETVRKDGPGLGIRFRALSPSWVKRKIDMGRDPWALSSSKAYARAIVVKASGPNSVGVTVRDGIHPETTDLKYSEIANYLENGTRKMDPLPHWRPALRDARRRAKEYFGRMPRGTVSFDR